MVPVTDNALKLPTDVMLGCAAVVNVPPTKLAVTRLPKSAFIDLILPPSVTLN